MSRGRGRRQRHRQGLLAFLQMQRRRHRPTGPGARSPRSPRSRRCKATLYRHLALEAVFSKAASLVTLPVPLDSSSRDPCTDEVMNTILNSFDRLILFAREAIERDRVNLFDRYRVNSFILKRPHRRPLSTSLLKSTYKKYQRVWKQILCLVYRLAHLRLSPRLRYQLTDVQQLALDALLNAARADLNGRRAAAAMDHERERGRMAMRLARDTLDRRCLDLCIALLDHSLRGDLFDSVVAGPLAAVGIDQDWLCFREPTNYTSQLSAFIKIGQLLVVLRAIAGADLAEVDFPTDLPDDMMNHFVVFGTESPMDYAQRLRCFWANIRDTTTSIGHIIWSDDGLPLSYKHFELDLPEFRWFLRDQMQEAQQHLRCLLFYDEVDEHRDCNDGNSKGDYAADAVPKGTGSPATGSGSGHARLPGIRLRDLRDNPACGDVGCSFLLDSHNKQLHGHERFLLHRCSSLSHP
ncbi:hypothetical protein LTS18_003285 [Coniosporium uncinatum]|uniref:Uncharacterized protein n=1 Tax=Coniosporium uncinatum TaxID=93489 RepID=A0ACC3DBH1_9PEZI|nr:hypothetical protein LTS18_003285 [Coniosporium uncinatum]